VCPCGGEAAEVDTGGEGAFGTLCSGSRKENDPRVRQTWNTNRGTEQKSSTPSERGSDRIFGRGKASKIDLKLHECRVKDHPRI